MDEPPALPRNVSLVHNMADFAAFLDVLGYSFDADLERLKAQTREGQPWDEGDLTSMYVGDFLHTWARWLHDACLQPGARMADEMKTLTWQTLAFQVHAASGYE
jgi:hypothetical protein